MKPKELQLVADLLDQMSDDYSNHGCNDWDWPDDWTAAEREEFAEKMNDWLADDDGDRPWSAKRAPGDHFVMAYLAAAIRAAEGKERE